MNGSGDYVNETAGETLGKHTLVYRGVDGYWYLADADTAATMPVLGITMSAIPANRKGEVLLEGYIGDSSWTWTGGAEVYASTTAGELTQTMPTGVGDVVQVVAIAVESTIIQFTGKAGNALYASNTLEGETAFVGFDPSKSHYVNYFLCDGTADDVQIQDAFDYLATLGEGSLMAESGTYDITATIVPTAGSFTLRGQGREATIFKLGANHHLLQLVSLDDISIMDMSFDGTKATYASDLWVGLLLGTVDNLYVDNCDFYDFAGKGCYAREVTDSVFASCRFYDNTQDGLYLESNGAGNITQKISVSSCFAYSNGRKGFNNGEIKNVTFTDCQSYSNTEDGWNLEGSSDNSYQLENVNLENCIAFSNTSAGIRVQQECFHVELISCTSYSNGNNGLYLRGNNTYPMKDIKVLGGSYYLNQTNGISVSYGMENVIIADVALYNNDQADSNNDGLSLSDETNIYNVIITNTHAYDDQGAPTQDRGIDLSTADLTNHKIKVSDILGSGNTTSLFRGTGVQIPTVTVPFVDGSDPQDSGFLVDANTEYARAYLLIPREASEVKRILIYARSGAAEADKMRVETVIYGAGDNEAYTTHNGSEVDLQSNTSNFAADDIIHWICDPAGVTGLTGGDSVEVKVLHEVAGGDDCETDAYFRTVTVEYV